MAIDQDKSTLGPDESQQLWKQLQARWAVRCHVDGDYWYPLTGIELPPDIIAFQADWFYRQLPLRVLHNILQAHGISRVWELREGGAAYEMDCELLEPCYECEEGYWTSEGLDWLLYASHESSLTVGGEWFIAAIQAVWPHWQQYIWQNY